MERVVKSELPLAEVKRNIGALFLDNFEKFSDKNAFAEKRNGKYLYWTWRELTTDISKFSEYLSSINLKSGERVAFITSNSYKRLVCEMAVMSMGCVSVPIFQSYPAELLSELLKFSEVKFLIIENPENFKPIKSGLSEENILFLESNDQENNSFDMAIKKFKEDHFNRSKDHFLTIDPDHTALIMYTSGTTSFPKGVELSHQNILSQQTALESLWKPEPGMRFLCYLPWHHSFGGLFERFFALHSGGCLAVDDSLGKNTELLFENFNIIKPHIYFSVPKVYQEIVAKVQSAREYKNIFFHPELKFVFTAAAPLPMSTSSIFKSQEVPVAEGWGLTETAPCCTLTELTLDRETGIVGHPIPGVSLKLTDEGEILVKGPNVMKGYFKNKEATEKVFTDGWFHTGDIGEIEEKGLRIITRKDRVFKLTNAEKVYPTAVENHMRSSCKYIKQVYLFGSGQKNVYALIFPNFDLFSSDLKNDFQDAECEEPRDINHLSNCLNECMVKINSCWKTKFERVAKAVIINRELTLENSELTPSFKLIPKKIAENYKDYIDCLEQNRINDLPRDCHLIDLQGKER